MSNGTLFDLSNLGDVSNSRDVSNTRDVSILVKQTLRTARKTARSKIYSLMPFNYICTFTYRIKVEVRLFIFSQISTLYSFIWYLYAYWNWIIQRNITNLLHILLQTNRLLIMQNDFNFYPLRLFGSFLTSTFIQPFISSNPLRLFNTLRLFDR